MSKTFVLLENIRSMHNVGSFFRTCDGAGVAKMFITGYTAFPPRSQITKTALGAETSVPWQHFEHAPMCVQRLKEQGVFVVAIEKNEKSVSMSKMTLPKDQDVCFIFGNEIDGVSEELLALAHTTVHIPMLGSKESLNVSVAGGIIVYYPFERN